MKQLTQILTLYHTSNFIAESNKDGKIIDADPEAVCQILPDAELADLIETIDGKIITNHHFTKVFIPLDFSQNPPASLANILPDELIFLVSIDKEERIRYSGINFGKRIFFITPKNTTANYVFGNKNIACKPCCKNDIISADDLVHCMPADVSIDVIQRLINKPLGNNSQVLDLKIKAGADTVIITKNEDLRNLHKILSLNTFHKLHLTFQKNSDNSMLMDFPELLITPTALAPSVAGIVRIPLASLALNETDRAKYDLLNNFILHFPSLQSTVKLTVNTDQFENTSKLFFNDTEVLNPTVSAHPQIVNYKQVVATVNNCVLYMDKPRTVIIQTGTKKNSSPVNPINNYDPTTNTATIVITK